MININKLIEVFDNSKDYQLTKNDMTINSVLDLGNYYVVSVVPKNIKINETFMDGLFRIDKKLSSVKPFSLEDDRAKYLKALKNPLYVRTRKVVLGK